MAGDPSFDKVALLLSGDSASDLSTYSRTVTLSGGASISTAQKKYGSASFGFESPGSVDVDSGSALYLDGDFCIDAWVFLLSQSNAYGAIVGSRAGAYGPGADLIFAGGVGSAGNVNRLAAGGYALNAAGASLVTAPVALNTWYHVRLNRAGSTLRLFLDGELQGSSTFSGVFDLSSGGGARVGRNAWDGANGYLHGYVDDVRVKKGDPVQTGNFTPAPNPSRFPQISGVVRVESAPASRTVRAYHRDTGAFVGSATSDPSTGAYTINCTTLSDCCVLCLDDSGGTTYNDQIARASPA